MGLGVYLLKAFLHVRACPAQAHGRAPSVQQGLGDETEYLKKQEPHLASLGAGG